MLCILLGNPRTSNISKDSEVNYVNAGSNAAQVTSVDVLSSGSTSSGIQAVTAKVGVSLP